MSIRAEFETFIKRGNVVDLAIGVIIGASFGKVVSSLVEDIMMPPIGLLVGKTDFSHLSLTLLSGEGGQPGIALRYGSFVNATIDFLIVAIAIFMVVKVINRIMPKPVEQLEVTTKSCGQCCNDVPLEAKKCGFCCSPL